VSARDVLEVAGRIVERDGDSEDVLQAIVDRGWAKGSAESPFPDK
jgi:hypothetical protein